MSPYGLVRLCHRSVERVDAAYRALVTALGRGITLTVLALALVTFIAGSWHEPTNTDSLTYHLARTTYWIQAHTVAHFETTVLHQLYHPPLSSYGLMLIRLFTGSDRLAFVLSWLSYLGCLVWVYKIARRLNAPAGFAVLYAATLPMALLQASSTQNNLLMAFWLLGMVWFILDDAPLYVGVSVGLAMLTKTTAYLYAAPFLVWFVFRSIGNPPNFKKVWPVVLAGLIAFTLNAPHWLRNWDWFGSPMPATLDYGGVLLNYNNAEISPRMLISGVARNLAQHLPIPGDAITEALGFDLTDPGITWDGNPTTTGILYYTDSSGGAPFHVALVIVVLVPAVMWQRARTIALCLLSGWLLFCLLIKWQPWHVRLHLPLLLLWSPIVAAVLPRSTHRALSMGLVLFAALVLLLNDDRSIPAWFRPVALRDYEQAYAATAARLKASDCRVIRFDVGANEPEYLLHRLMPDATFTHDASVPACAVVKAWYEE